MSKKRNRKLAQNTTNKTSAQCYICRNNIGNIPFTKLGVHFFCKHCGTPVPEPKRAPSKGIRIARADQDVWNANLMRLFTVEANYDGCTYAAIDKRNGQPYIVRDEKVQWGGVSVERKDLLRTKYSKIERLADCVGLGQEIAGISYTNWQYYVSKLTDKREKDYLEKLKKAEFLRIHSDNCEEYDLFLPGNTYPLGSGSYETLGCGMHYGTVQTYADLRVEKEGYYFSGKPEAIAFGFFINMTYEEIETFLSSVLLSCYVVPSGGRNMHTLICRLKASDIFNKKQFDEKTALLQEKKEQYNHLSKLHFLRKQRIAREIREINDDLGGL